MGREDQSEMGWSGSRLLSALAFCVAAHASQVVTSLDAAVEVVEFPPANQAVKRLSSQSAQPDIKGAIAAANKAAKSATTAAEEAEEVAHTPKQKMEAKKLLVQAQTTAKAAEAKEYLATPGAAQAKSFAQIEADDKAKQEDARKLAQVKEFSSEVKQDESAIQVRNNKIENQKAVYLANLKKGSPPGTSAETKEAVAKAVAIEAGKGQRALAAAKEQFSIQMKQQRVNMTSATQAAVTKAMENGEKNMAQVEAKCSLDKKRAEMKREYDSMVAEKQQTANAMLKSQLATSEESAHIKAAASQKAAAIVANEAVKLSEKYPSGATEQSAATAKLKELSATSRNTKLRNLAHRALADANDAKRDEAAATVKTTQLEKIEVQSAAANETAVATALNLATSTKASAVSKERSRGVKKKVSQTLEYFEQAKSDLDSAKSKEKATKAEVMAAKTKQIEREADVSKTTNLNSKLDAREADYKAAGSARLLSLKSTKAQEEKDRIEADMSAKVICVDPIVVGYC